MRSTVKPMLPILITLVLPSAAWAIDADGDGFDEMWDCDDTDPAINFLAQDVPGDGVDSDCNTLDGPMQDSDGDNLPDGFENQYGPNPMEADTDGDGVSDFDECQLDQPFGCNAIDDNGDGIPAYADPAEPFSSPDADGDGFDASQDCDDSDASVYPGAPEVCDGVDNDCDGLVDDMAVDGEPFWEDADGDGFGDPSLVEVSCNANPGQVDNGDDCDDSDPFVNPDAQDIPNDGIDQDCDGIDAGNPQDADGDGFSAPDDCDDTDATVYPGAPEVCDGIDNDCNGLVDDQVPGGGFLPVALWYQDLDGDGYGDGPPIESCSSPGPDYVMVQGDCDDTDASIYPAAPEVCDGVDNDCDGLVDENAGGGLVVFEDLDGDGFGGQPLQDCTPPGVPGTTTMGGDCDDLDPTVNPAAVEIPGDGIDQDCDGLDDEDPAEDADGDGFPFFEDCNDSDATVFPGAPELCDGIDQNCDGIAEVDSDLDGLPDDCDDCPNQVGPADNGGCPDDAPGDDVDGDGYTAPDDCDDSDPLVFPGAIEICEDGIDQSCDGQDAACGPDDDDDEDDDDKPGGCQSSGAGASFTAMFLPLPLLLGLARRRQHR